jgi:hypothetical protein
VNVRQFDLEDNQGARLTCWLADDKRLKPGVWVTLRETGKRQWLILKQYDTVVENADINRRWRVGGLT